MSTGLLAVEEASMGLEVMAYPNYDNEYTLDTDAIKYAIDTVLSQMQEDKERVIA